MSRISLPMSLVATALSVSFLECHAAPESKVLATVNGMELTDVDVMQYWQQSRGRGSQPDPKLLNGVLGNIVLQELTYQRALELGLDADPTYQEELRRLEAQLDSFKRRTLSSLFDKREIIEKAKVTDEEAQAYFSADETRLRTEIKVWQILRRDERQIRQDLSELEAGMPFEKVALRQFPNLPEGAGKPWVLGFLRWEQVPAAWLSTVGKLQEGETSGIIRGQKNRFWLIKLIERRINPDLTYADSKTKIVEILTSDKVIQLRKKSNRALRDRARIVYSNLPVEDWLEPAPTPE